MLISELLAGLTAKLAGLGMAAKAGMGLTLAAASTTAAGAAGVLPAPVQHAVATAVSTATPFSFPDTADSHAVVGAAVSVDATGATDGVPGVDGKAVADAAKAQAGANSGTTGLDRANQTPAAGHVPTSVPVGAPATPGAPASTGLGTASGTPAAGHVPSTVPPVTTGAHTGAGSQGSVGVGTANSTPAAGRIPANVPGRP